MSERTFASVAEQMDHVRRMREKAFPPTPNVARLASAQQKTVPQDLTGMSRLDAAVTLAEQAARRAEDVAKRAEAILALVDGQQGGEALPPRRGIEAIVAGVALKHGLRPEDIRGNRRFSHIVTARWEAWGEVMKAYPHWSVMRTADYFGVDHTSVLHAQSAEWKPVYGTAMRAHKALHAFTEGEVEQFVKAGMSSAQIARRFGVTPRAVKYILNHLKARADVIARKGDL